MRAYPNDSPQAAARIVALAMLADGQVCKAEIELLDRLHAHERLGLQPEELHSIVHAMCDDLLSTAQLNWADACQVDPQTLAALTAEIDDAEMRLEVLGLCVAVLARVHERQPARRQADGRVRRSRDDGQHRSLAWLTSQAAEHGPARSIEPLR